MSIFKQAKAKASTTKTKSSEKPVVKIDEEQLITLGYSKKDAKIAVVEFENNIVKWAGLKEEASNIEAQCKMIEADSKQKAKDVYIQMYDKNEKRPETFEVVTANNKGKFQFIIADNYLKIDSDRADELKDQFGEDIVEEFNEFKFDADLLNKYEDKISAMFEKLDIPADDKSKLIKCTTTVRVKKGTIDNVTKFGKASEVIPAIQPIVSVKNVEAIGE